jgi:hypothetical protein
VIGVNPAVKMKSDSATPEIATASPSGGQVPMTDDVPTGSETVSVDVSMMPAGSPICSDEDDKDEHEDSGHVDDDILRSESLRIQHGKSAKFGYLPMMTVATLGALNAESFCERVLSCVKLVVSDLHVSLKADEIRILVILRMNHEFTEYMRASYPDTPLSDFRAADTYVRANGGFQALDDDDDDE